MNDMPTNIDEKALIATLHRYYMKPRKPRMSLEKLSQEFDSISPMTLWRLFNNKVNKPHQQTIYQIYHFLEKKRWIKAYEHERKHGSWIHYAKDKLGEFRERLIKFW